MENFEKYIEDKKCYKIEGYKKDAVIAKVTTENEQLLREVA